MNDEFSDYGLWLLVVINSLVFILFAFSFARPRTPRDWRSFGAFSAFLVALFTEMYGFPLTIYLLSGWLSSRFPEVDWLAHDSGHLLEMMFGWKDSPHIGPFHVLSTIFIFGGFILLASAWRVLNPAQRLQMRRDCTRIPSRQRPGQCLRDALFCEIIYRPRHQRIESVGGHFFFCAQIGQQLLSDAV